MNSVNTDIARPARRDLSTDVNSRRSTSLDRSQNQGLGSSPEALAGLANSQAQGAQADRDRGSLAGGSEFAKLLQSTAAASNIELGSSLGSNPTAAPAAASLEALSRSQASDPLAGAFSNISSSEAAQVHLSSPLHQPAFAPELGARLSLLAADGVQEAQLHLNPADMGPVQVQIVIEGQQAQISFHAEQADTRRVLEQSLPDLAAALRDNGLTLSGGGVFQQAQDSSRQTPGAQDQRSARRGPRGLSTDSSSGPESIQAMPLRRSQGVVDLYA